MEDYSNPPRPAAAASEGQAVYGERKAVSGENKVSAAGPATGASPPGWERDVLEKLVLSLVEEKRRAWRWSIFFRLVGIGAAVLLVAFLTGLFDFSGKGAVETQHTALIDIHGVLDSGAEANADALISSLQSAYKDKNTKGIVMRINSPGGSPVQAGMIVDEMLRLKAKYPKTPLYVVVEEICASGGYYVAAAAEKIFVDKASLVGSIGVLLDGFGFVGTMEKLGVERRLITAGSNKGLLDPFSPMQAEQRSFAQAMVAEIHEQFIDVVRKGRGTRLKESPDMFTGLIWSGAKSVELGLADAFGTVESVARDVIKAEEIVDFSPRDNLAEKLAKRIGVSAGQAVGRTLRGGFETPVVR